MTQLYNQSAERFEATKQVKCPRCSGFGAVSGDWNKCTLCEGWGRVWESVHKNGWYRALYARQYDSTMY